MHGKVAFGVGVGIKATVMNMGPKISAQIEAFQLRTNPKILSNGRLPAGMELGWEASAAVGLGPDPLTIDAGIGSSTSSPDRLNPNIINDGVFTIFALGGYVGLGAEISLQFDTMGLFDDLIAIWS